MLGQSLSSGSARPDGLGAGDVSTVTGVSINALMNTRDRFNTFSAIDCKGSGDLQGFK